MSYDAYDREGYDEMHEDDELHPSDIYCGICGLDYPCGDPAHEVSLYNPPADYMERRP